MTNRINTAPAEAGGTEWRKLRARLLGEDYVPTAEDIRHELEDKAREENEAFRHLSGDDQ